MQRNKALHKARGYDEWRTPRKIFDELNKEFHFELDPCATSKNHLTEFWIPKKIDGLSVPWSWNAFMNPPFHQVHLWIKKAYEESQKGITVVCLVPARVDTQWWFDYALKGEIRWIRGRIKYDGKTNAPFASCLVIFTPNESGPTEAKGKSSRHRPRKRT